MCDKCKEINGWVLTESGNWWMACPECNEEEEMPFPGSTPIDMEAIVWGLSRIAEGERVVDMSGFWPSN